MEGWMLAVVLKPLGLLVLLCGTRALAAPVRRYMPDCWLKRVLFISWKV